MALHCLQVQAMMAEKLKKKQLKNIFKLGSGLLLQISHCKHWFANCRLQCSEVYANFDQRLQNFVHFTPRYKVTQKVYFHGQ